jgi:PilZ domain
MATPIRNPDTPPCALPQRAPKLAYHQMGGSFVKKDLRRVPRYAFIATAELIEQKTDVRIATRVSELSLHGCYLDMMNPFPAETLVLVRISAGDVIFQAKSKIVYVQPNLGAGVTFLEVTPENEAILQRWLAQAKQDQHQRVG